MSWAAVFLALGAIIHLVPPEGPSISTVWPPFAHPSGGEVITITGRNFQDPVRVVFDFGGGSSQEAFVVSTSPTEISVLTPAVTILPGAQTIDASVVVVTNAGTIHEKRVVFGTPFRFTNERLTPRLSGATPNTGPLTGGTRVTILGEGFQVPVQVIFGSNEARVITVSFTEIVVVAPAMLDQDVVDIHVRNIRSETSATLPAAFRYLPKSQIIWASPASGPETRATRVTIDGVGFQAPVSVIIGGVEAQPIMVSGTRVVAMTTPFERTCRDTSGPVIVTNILDGDQAVAPIPFTYVGTQPEILSIEPARAVAGGTIEVTVWPTVAGAQFSIDGVPVTPLSTRIEGPMTTFVLPVPNSFVFPTMACDDGGTRALPVRTTVVYTRRDTSCIATARLIVRPDFPERCTPRATLQP